MSKPSLPEPQTRVLYGMLTDYGLASVLQVILEYLRENPSPGPRRGTGK